MMSKWSQFTNLALWGVIILQWLTIRELNERIDNEKKWSEYWREAWLSSKDYIKWSVKDEDGNWIDTKCNLCRRTKLEVNLDDFCADGERSE